MQYNIHYAKTHFSQLTENAMSGEEVIIAKAGKPLLKLVPVDPPLKKRPFGTEKGKIWISKDFDSLDFDSNLMNKSRLFPKKK